MESVALLRGLEKLENVPNVHDRPEHIACSSTTNSEIVVPIKNSKGNVIVVLDVDSDELAAFSDEDVGLLERVCQFLEMQYHS